MRQIQILFAEEKHVKHSYINCCTVDRDFSFALSKFSVQALGMWLTHIRYDLQTFVGRNCTASYTVLFSWFDTDCLRWTTDDTAWDDVIQCVIFLVSH